MATRKRLPAATEMAIRKGLVPPGWPVDHMRDPAIRRYSVDICDDCIALKGEMCHTPGCVFIRCTMAEVREHLDMLLIVPIVDGQRLEKMQDGEPLQEGQ